MCRESASSRDVTFVVFPTPKCAEELGCPAVMLSGVKHPGGEFQGHVVVLVVVLVVLRLGVVPDGVEGAEIECNSVDDTASDMECRAVNDGYW